MPVSMNDRKVLWLNSGAHCGEVSPRNNKSDVTVGLCAISRLASAAAGMLFFRLNPADYVVSWAANYF